MYAISTAVHTKLTTIHALGLAARGATQHRRGRTFTLPTVVVSQCPYGGFLSSFHYFSNHFLLTGQNQAQRSWTVFSTFHKPCQKEETSLTRCVKVKVASDQIRSDQSLSHVQLFATLWISAHQSSLSLTISQRFLKLMSIEPVMPSNYLILCHPLLLLPSIVPSIGFFPNELAFCIKWTKYQIFSTGPSNEYQGQFPLGLTGLISLLSK